MTYSLFGRSRWPCAPKHAGFRVGAVGKKNSHSLIFPEAKPAKPVTSAHRHSRKDSSHEVSCRTTEALRESVGRLHGCSHHVFDSPIAFTEDVAPSINVPTMNHWKTTAPMVRHWEGLP